jgi:hypothetical protein
MNLMKTKKEIIEETVEYYRTHERGLNSANECVYFNDETQDVCAIGRCMSNPVKFKDYTAPALSFDSKERRYVLEDELLPEYKGHERIFWDQLQEFHDCVNNWAPYDEGWKLTKDGTDKFNRLMKYCGDPELD